MKLRFGVKESIAATPLATIFGLAPSDSHGPRVESSGGGAVVDVMAALSVEDKGEKAGMVRSAGPESVVSMTSAFRDAAACRATTELRSSSSFLMQLRLEMRCSIFVIFKDLSRQLSQGGKWTHAPTGEVAGDIATTAVVMVSYVFVFCLLFSYGSSHL